VTVDLGTARPRALDLIDSIGGIAGNNHESDASFRIYVVFKPEFQAWVRAGLRYSLLKDDAKATDFGGWVHPNFHHQFKTLKAPNLQWNYTEDFRCGDIDVDGSEWWRFWSHLGKYNSDARQWLEVYRGRFGGPGFTVRPR